MAFELEYREYRAHLRTWSFAAIGGMLVAFGGVLLTLSPPSLNRRPMRKAAMVLAGVGLIRRALKSRDEERAIAEMRRRALIRELPFELPAEANRV